MTDQKHTPGKSEAKIIQRIVDCTTFEEGVLLVNAAADTMLQMIDKKIPETVAKLACVKAENQKLKEFARFFLCNPDNFECLEFDACDVYDLALKLGLLYKDKATAEDVEAWSEYDIQLGEEIDRTAAILKETAEKESNADQN